VRFLILNIVIIFSAIAFIKGQTTYSSEPDSSSKHRSKTILIVPFESNYYLSEIDRKIGLQSNLQADEILNKFRDELIKQLTIDLSIDFFVKILHNSSNTISTSSVGLETVYAATRYVYQKGINAEEEVKEKKKTSGIKEGEIVAEARNLTGKYFNATFPEKDSVIMVCNFKGTDLLLFITMVELRNKLSDNYLDYTIKANNREFKVHYSIYDKIIEQLYGGYIKVEFPVKMNNISEIIKTSFPDLSKSLNSHIVQYK